MIRARVYLVALLVLLLASACRVDAVVEIDVNDDGSGLVSLVVIADREAVAQVDDFESGVLLDDLADANWTVGEVEFGDDGGALLRAEKPFDSAEHLPAVLAEIAGEGVIFDNIVLSVDRSFSTTNFELTGSLDPTPPIEAFGDDVVTQTLGLPLGREVTLQPGSLGLGVSVTLPGGVVTNAETTSENSEVASWLFEYGDAPITIDATSDVTDVAPRLWAGVALAALAALLLVLGARAVGWGINILRTPKGRRRRDHRRRQAAAARREEEANRPRQRLLRVLLVDIHGVVLRPTDPVEGLLLPMVRAENPDVDPDHVREVYRKLVLGRLTSGEFWSDVGLGPKSDDLELAYLSSFRLVPGLFPFLERMQAMALPVAAIGNDPRSWGDRLRRLTDVEGLVSSWIVSGDVSSMLPEPALFEATRRTLTVDFYDCLYLSCVPANLDAARKLGMDTAYFIADPTERVETDHEIVRGFDDLLRGQGH